MKLVKYPNLYNVTWINITSIDVQEKYQILIQIVTYTDNMWCDILHMDVGHIILGRSWLFDLDVIVHGRTNHCSFIHNDKKVKLMLTHPKPPTSKKKIDKNKRKIETQAPEKKGGQKEDGNEPD